MATEIRLYVYIESLALPADRRDTLIDALKQWGTRNDSQFPNERNHWRVRPDNQAAIYEGVLDADLMTAQAMKTRLVNLLSVQASRVTYSMTQTNYGPVVTYSYNGTPYLRLGVFGGVNATWAQSWVAVQQYLGDNLIAWEVAL